MLVKAVDCRVICAVEQKISFGSVFWYSCLCLCVWCQWERDMHTVTWRECERAEVNCLVE